MQHSTNTKWTEGMSFDWEVGGHKVVIDAGEAVGGKNKGPQPKEFMLASLFQHLFSKAFWFQT